MATSPTTGVITGRTGAMANRFGNSIVWLTRLAWIGVAVVAPVPIGAWLSSPTRHNAWIVWTVAAVLWLIGVISLVVPSVVTLTAARVLTPLATVALIVIGVAEPSAAAVAACAAAALAALGVGSAEVGRIYVQASAYGDEDRFPLRPPPVYLALCVLTWGAASALVITALWLWTYQTVLGIGVSAIAVAVAVWGWSRWHRLSRRWAVVVPAGLVLHDHLVLAETVMVPRAQLVSVVVAGENTDAFDLTGGVSSRRVEFTTASPVTVLMAASPKRPTGTAFHLTAGLIAPSRPGQFLRRTQRSTTDRG